MKRINKLFLSKVTSAVTIIGLIAFLVGPKITMAASLVSIKDVMTTQAISTTAKHTITYTMAAGHNFQAADRIAFDFVNADFTLNAIGNWQTADFTFNDGTARTINAVSSSSGVDPSCTAGANNVCVNIDTTNNTFTVFAAGSFTASSNAASVTFTIDGTTTAGTGTMTNKSSDVDSSKLTITDSGSNTDSGAGAVVVETNDVVTVTATVDPVLTLAIGSNSVALGTLSTGSANSGSHTARIASNATGGFQLTYNGATLTSGSNTIPAYGSQASSVAGTAGFGINMVSNTTPSVGSNVTTNSGTCDSLPADYGTTNKYSFVASTATLLTSQTHVGDCTYTVSYVANMSNTTVAGSYSTTLTYIAAATF